VTTYTGSLTSFNGRGASILPSISTLATTQVQLQNLSGAPLTFSWFVQALDVFAFRNRYIFPRKTRRGEV